MSEGRILAAIAAGGAIGSLGRWLLSLAAGGAVWGTLLVNITGAFSLGLLVARLEHGEHHPLLRPFLAVGLLGGWTTYSTFMLDGHALAASSLPSLLGYLAATIGLGLLGALAGMLLGERLWHGAAVDAAPVTEEEL